MKLSYYCNGTPSRLSSLNSCVITSSCLSLVVDYVSCDYNFPICLSSHLTNSYLMLFFGTYCMLDARSYCTLTIILEFYCICSTVLPFRMKSTQLSELDYNNTSLLLRHCWSITSVWRTQHELKQWTMSSPDTVPTPSQLLPSPLDDRIGLSWRTHMKLWQEICM